MLRAGFEPTIPVFERLKTVRVLDREAIGTDAYITFACKIFPHLPLSTRRS